MLFRSITAESTSKGEKMNRDQQIEAIVDFVNRHPESLASRTIRRRIAGPDEYGTDDGARLAESLQAVDEETLTGYYYLVR